MATTQKTKLLIWVTALTLIMACSIPSFSAPSAPAVDPGMVNTFIAQTARVAATQTVAALPSATLTPFVTATRPTATNTPTATATMLFLFYTPTTIVTLPTFTSAGAISNQNYACEVTRVSPPNGSTFDPRYDFDAFWTVRNIGKRSWERISVDYVYSSGAKIHRISGYDLEENVAVGRSINLGVDMRAPKDAGSYSTTWTMRIGDNTFCPLRLTIVVR